MVASPFSRLALLVVDSKAWDGNGGGKHELEIHVPLPHEVGDLSGIQIVRAVLVVLEDRGASQRPLPNRGAFSTLT